MGEFRYNDLWSYNISSGNWTWRGGANGNLIERPSPIYPNQIGGTGWPGGIYHSAFCRHSESIFIFGGYEDNYSMF